MADSSEITEEDMNNFIDRAKKIASKAVLHTLVELIKHNGGNEALCRKVLKRKPYDYCKSVVFEFNETPQKLHMSLTMAPADYDSTVDIPHESYTEKICTWRAALVVMAQNYWKYFSLTYPELVENIKKAVENWNGQLNIAPNGTSLYFTESCPYKVSVFCVYSDERTNTMYWKKTTKKK